MALMIDTILVFRKFHSALNTIIKSKAVLPLRLNQIRRPPADGGVRLRRLSVFYCVIQTVDCHLDLP